MTAPVFIHTAALGARCILLMACLVGSSSAHAYDRETARANMAQDLMTCMTYYNYNAKANRRDGQDPANMDNSARSALTLARVYEPQQKKLEAMSELSAKMINKLVQEEGFTRLVLNYAESCKSILEQPTDRMQYWFDKN